MPTGQFDRGPGSAWRKAKERQKLMSRRGRARIRHEREGGVDPKDAAARAAELFGTVEGMPGPRVDVLPEDVKKALQVIASWWNLRRT